MTINIHQFVAIAKDGYGQDGADKPRIITGIKSFGTKKPNQRIQAILKNANLFSMLSGLQTSDDWVTCAAKDRQETAVLYVSDRIPSLVYLAEGTHNYTWVIACNLTLINITFIRCIKHFYSVMHEIVNPPKKEVSDS